MTEIKKKASSAAVEKKEPAKKEKKVKSDLAGKYIQAIGRRKTSVAQVRMHEKGTGLFTVNGVDALEFFKKEDNINLALQPLKAVSKLKDFDLSVVVKGGGTFGQIEATSHGIARALLKYDPELKALLKTGAYLTRDPRQKERKKPGLKKARKAPQWSKR